MGLKGLLRGWFSDNLRGNRSEYCMVHYLLHLSLLLDGRQLSKSIFYKNNTLGKWDVRLVLVGCL